MSEEVLSRVLQTIYALNYFLRPSRNNSILPSNRHSQRSSWTESSTTVVLKGLHLRIQTTAWNLSHDLLAESFNNGRKASLCRVMRWFYDAGTVVSLIGMVIAFGFLLTTSGMSVISLARKIGGSPAVEVPVIHAKRSLDVFSGSAAPSTSDSFIKPIIPGVTVPFAHLPIILVAVFLAQIVHELGHAITAAIESLPMLSVGASFTLVVPSAFVTFSSAALDSLRPRARARVVAAGPFHNLLLWVLLVSAGWTRLGEIFWSVGYRDVSTLGKVVLSVDQYSPLYGYLPLGSVITKLDDAPLSSQNASYDGWATYLNGDKHDQVLGWCATLPRRVNAAKRCVTDDECSLTSQCIKPDADERLLRLTVQQASEQSLEVILWSGPTEEIWEEVQVGTLIPRLFFLPISLPYSATIFWE
ncbi:hypothetical protein H0H92_000525 [Tricholoma furcatifolium]|nr:hypothetical protein H0H92_000525 [Tricholoma furcatifolium]